MAAVLSFDFGTGGVRAGVYSSDGRAMLSIEDVSYETIFPRTGWAEQDPKAWLEGMIAAGRAAIKSAGITDIEAVCVATTASTTVACTAAGAPMRPAILWMDCRASDEARMTANVSHPVMSYSGGSDAVEWLVPKAMWLSRHENHNYVGADVICEALDFINFHLTGEWVGSRMNAACKWNYDSLNGRFVPEIYDELGVPDLIDKLPPRIVPVGGVIAPMSARMVEALGLTFTPMVAQGGIDAHIGMLGAGTVAAGGMLIIGGTSVVQLTQLTGPENVDGFWGPYPNALVDDHWLVEAGQVSAGSILDWLVGDIFGLDREGHIVLMQEVADCPGRAEGLLALDFWMGNRTPYRDGQLRGAIMGLSLGHGRADIYAALVDAIALGTANVLAVLGERGVGIDRIVLAGGICKNPVWLKATIDAIGRPVTVVRDGNLSLLGAAVCSLTALGVFPDLIAASAACAVGDLEIEPDVQRSAWYQGTLGLYRDATDSLTPTLHALSVRQNGGAAQ
ncbi:ribulokinase [Devosia sp.]|uniref:FGGY-family carbohydrate kinase n=1 Tax=Devosia sp. TaxID=1871048 RepID=UPI002733FD2E|nr:FGGY-family carbohydrate kinase [Devosia sp.]MDP2779722.1 FGGY-family carbohydrate kinase [Devosia sp.]